MNIHNANQFAEAAEKRFFLVSAERRGARRLADEMAYRAALEAGESVSAAVEKGRLAGEAAAKKFTTRLRDAAAAWDAAHRERNKAFRAHISA